MTRKRIDLEFTEEHKSARVEVLHINDMIISNNLGTSFCFKRLRYRGIPVTIASGKRKGEFKTCKLLFANRDDFIRDLYKLKKTISPCSFHSHMKTGVVSYLRYIDEFEPESSPYSLETMNRSIKYFNNLALQGKAVSKASRVQAALSILLKGFDRTYDANKLIFVPGYEASGKQCAYDIESELKPVARLLIKSLLELMNHIRNKTHPEIHPIYNEKLFNEMADISKWKNVNIKRNAFKSAMKPNNVVKKKYGYSDETLRKITLLNQSSRCALQLFFMWTGMNDTVLKSMKRSDIYIKSIGANSYIFEGVKGRANYKKIDHSLGFSKYAKKLIEDWLEISKEHFELTGIKDIDNQPFIPYIDSNLHIKYFTHHSTSPQGINKLIEKLFPFRLNATRFRKTKSDILMRATEDIYLVSQGLKNTIDVVTHSYTSGVKADSVRQLSATVESLSLISQGASISESTKNAKVLHSDILSDYNYKQRLKRNEIPVATLAPHGIRCLIRPD